MMQTGMRRLRRVISKQSTSATASPVIPESNSIQNDTHDERNLKHIESQISVGSDTSAREGSFLSMERWGILGRSSQQQKKEAADGPTHRSSQSFSMPASSSVAATMTATTPTITTTAPANAKDLRHLREPKHKRTSSSVLPAKLSSLGTGIFTAAFGRTTHHTHSSSISAADSKRTSQQSQQFQPYRTSLQESVIDELEDLSVPVDFIGYPPGGLEINSGGISLHCEQKSPDICEYTVSRGSAGFRVGDLATIAVVSWAAHIFFRGPAIFACLPMLLYLVRSGLQVYQEKLTVIRNVGIQTEAITLAGFRKVRSFEQHQIQDLIIHEALQLFEYRYYMAILPNYSDQGKNGPYGDSDNIVIVFSHLLPNLDALLPVYHGARCLLFSR